MGSVGRHGRKGSSSSHQYRLNVLAPVPPRNKATAAPTIAHNTHHPSSALEQATAGFAAETGQLASFERSKGSKKGGRKAVLSTKARQRRVAGQEKEEAYNDRLSGRVARRNRRAERMELLRRVY